MFTPCVEQSRSRRRCTLVHKRSASMNAGSLWQSNVPGRPWNSRDRKLAPLPPPSNEVKRRIHEAAIRVHENYMREQADREPEPPRRSNMRLRDPSPRIATAMHEASRRNAARLAESSMSDATKKTDEPGSPTQADPIPTTILTRRSPRGRSLAKPNSLKLYHTIVSRAWLC